MKKMNCKHVLRNAILHFLLNRSSSRGNFIELLRWASSTDPIALSILKDSDRNSTYLRPTVQNEIISLLADHIRQQISHKVMLFYNFTRRLQPFYFFSLFLD